MASFMSAITLIGVSNENYQFGTQFVVINVSYGLATPIAAYLFLPVFYNMRVTSAYEVSFSKLRHYKDKKCLNFILVFGEAVRFGNANCRLAVIFDSDDSLHGNCVVRARVGA